jgi:hypothetical protein
MKPQQAKQKSLVNATCPVLNSLRNLRKVEKQNSIAGDGNAQILEHETQEEPEFKASLDCMEKTSINRKARRRGGEKEE